MATEIFAALKSDGRIQPVFEGVNVQAELRETLAITSITQSYRNDSIKNIEAVYTFPLPLDAVLLEMTVTIGEKTLKGTVLPKKEAERKYEDAITDGDAPVMLQNPQPGVYTMNVGNLLPGEKAKITFRYGMFQRWQGDSIRYHLPTTIAPRYGSAERAGFEPQQEPETSLLTENLFTFELKILGTLAGMAIESPSHQIGIERNDEGTESKVSLVRKSAFMDRDLIITVKKSNQQASTALMTKDGDEYLLWASFQPQFDLAEDLSPRSVKIVVDCSGSMCGDSIAQARKAVLKVLDELRPQDWFNIVAFGSTATPLFNAQTKADKESLSYARGFLKKLDATMGGTELGSALEMAVRLRCPEKMEQDVLLITDGEIWEWESVVAKAQKSKHRFFTVGVGSAVSEAFVRTLAERTGGVCELVSPKENMAEKIHRHFKRIGTPRSSSNEIVWPVQPLRVFPESMPCIYDGDTCNLFAWFTEPPVGEIRLQVSLPDGSTQVLTSDISQINDEMRLDNIVPRMAAALKVREISEEKEGQEIALKYQLVSRWTNYLAIVVRDEDGKADTLPELHKVEQMLAAGWGGFGTVDDCYDAMYDMPCFLRKSVDTVEDRSVLYSIAPAASIAYSRRLVPVPIAAPQEDNSDDFAEMLDATLASGVIPKTIHLPYIPTSIETLLALLVDEGIDERTVIICFLYHFANSPEGYSLSRQVKRIITKAYKELNLDKQTAVSITQRLKIELGDTDLDEDAFEVPTFVRQGKSVGAAP